MIELTKVHNNMSCGSWIIAACAHFILKLISLSLLWRKRHIFFPELSTASLGTVLESRKLAQVVFSKALSGNLLNHCEIALYEYAGLESIFRVFV